MTKVARIDDVQARVIETIKARGSLFHEGQPIASRTGVIGLVSARQRTRTDLVAISVKKGDVP